MKQLLKMLAVHIALILVGIVICNAYFHNDLFNEHISTLMVLVGGVLLMNTVLCILFVNIQYSILCIYLSVFLIVSGAAWSVAVDTSPDLGTVQGTAQATANTKKDFDEIGKCPKTEWQIIIKYQREVLDLEESAKFLFTGPSDQAELAAIAIEREWNRTHSERQQATSCERTLLYVPKPYLVEFIKKNKRGAEARSILSLSERN